LLDAEDGGRNDTDDGSQDAGPESGPRPARVAAGAAAMWLHGGHETRAVSFGRR
jgi:hypothetical protein